MLVPAFIVAEATLSYVGLGFPDPIASWGTMLHDASNVRAFADFPWLLSPAAAMFLVVLGLQPGHAAPGIAPVYNDRPMNLRGVFAPIPTPFDRDDALDSRHGSAPHARAGRRARSTGIVVLGFERRGGAARRGRVRSRASRSRASAGPRAGRSSSARAASPRARRSMPHGARPTSARTRCWCGRPGSSSRR